MEDTNNENKNRFEQRLQSIAQAVMLAIVIWVGYSISDMGKSIAKLEVRADQSAREAAEVKIQLEAMRIQIVAADNANAAATAAVAAQTAAASAALAAQIIATKRK
jgi:hypothetical protein